MRIRSARLGDAPGIARVHVDSWQTTYRNIVSEEFLQSLSYEEREVRWNKGIARPESERCIYVAENEAGRVVGFASGGKEREGKYPQYDGELYAIYILEEVQRQRMGERLLQAVVKDLLQKAFKSMAVRVLADNRNAWKFYESFGASRIDTETIEIGDTKYEEIVYGWKHVEKLL